MGRSLAPDEPTGCQSAAATFAGTQDLLHYLVPFIDYQDMPSLFLTSRMFYSVFNIASTLIWDELAWSQHPDIQSLTKYSREAKSTFLYRRGFKIQWPTEPRSGILSQYVEIENEAAENYCILMEVGAMKMREITEALLPAMPHLRFYEVNHPNPWCPELLRILSRGCPELSQLVIRGSPGVDIGHSLEEDPLPALPLLKRATYDVRLSRRERSIEQPLNALLFLLRQAPRLEEVVLQLSFDAEAEMQTFVRATQAWKAWYKRALTGVGKFWGSFFGPVWGSWFRRAEGLGQAASRSVHICCAVYEEPGGRTCRKCSELRNRNIAPASLSSEPEMYMAELPISMDSSAHIYESLRNRYELQLWQDDAQTSCHFVLLERTSPPPPITYYDLRWL